MLVRKKLNLGIELLRNPSLILMTNTLDDLV